MTRPARGVTLLELLVALAVFTVIGVAAYTALFAVLDAREVTERQSQRLAAVQYTIGRLADDLRQTVGRGIQASQPAARQPVTTEPRIPGALAVTRGGLPNPAGLQRSTLARVVWRLRDDRLLRIVREHLGGRLAGKPTIRLMLDQVERFELRFLDANGEWRDRWPPLNETAAAADLPRAIEVTLELADWGTLTRLFALSRPDAHATSSEEAPP